MSRFIHAVVGAAIPVIPEVKVRAADGVSLVGERSPVAIAASYEAAGVGCLSVVTGRWFGGDLRLLSDVTARSGLPVLQKDFLTREAQLIQARELGAAAVLLTAALLPQRVLATLVDKALVLGLTPFVEVVNEAEVNAVPHANECVIAVNNKDIQVHERGPADLSRSERLLPAIRATGCLAPVSASGIDHPAQAARLVRAGFVAVLVGTVLLRSPDPATWLSRLTVAPR
ncbi:indole-3-glycerol phosphate synthase [Actinokineospora terrae]|uniref:indole-3-glycerol-phosphate synthase n=1 Tax=Actinokineospora terrae TaxID=155974 RepID=A0A1H9KI66_9PSEU|nr:indole-3-glycerol phosphate synthase [Actinokineospora terrae]SEQ98627.1 indole-3-glycerol phosphate synthase [Actinokineospora terrae]